MKTISASELTSMIAGIFRSRGLSERDSGIMADCLVHANLRGVDSHGAMKVVHYAKRVEVGSVNPTPNTKVERTAAATAMIDGDDGFGHVTMWDAMDMAIDMAKETGVAFVGINNSNHCGALSFFTSKAIEKQMIGFAFTQTDKGVVPVGGREPFCGTNPMSFGIPSQSGPPILLDMATSTVAGGHIYKARMLNKPIPDTWAYDAEGKPTTDPHKATCWTPAAGAKGYGLGVVVDALTGIMCGGTFGPHIPPMFAELEKRRKLCHLVAAVDFSKFAGGPFLLETVARMITELHAIEPAEGSQGVLAPGEPEYRTAIQRSAQGIPLDDKVWEDLTSLAG